MRSGDMSDSANPIYDPLSGDPSGANRTRFANNIIPASRISPVSAELFKLIPAAPVPSGRLTDFNAVIAKPLFDKSEKYDSATTTRSTAPLASSLAPRWPTSISSRGSAAAYRGCTATAPRTNGRRPWLPTGRGS
jgi:hypothetical protein